MSFLSSTSLGIQARQPLTIADLAARCECEFTGRPDALISSAAAVEDARDGSIVFAMDERRLEEAERSEAAAVLVGPGVRYSDKPTLRARNVRAAWAHVLQHLYPPTEPAPGIHPTSIIDPTAAIAASATVGPYCYVGRHSVIADRCALGFGVYVGDDVSIGAGSILHPRVVIGDRCVLGSRNLLFAGVVVGAEGFGLALEGGKYVRTPHIGIVRTGDDVEIGANSTVDRASLGETVLSDGVKLDNLVQVAHNVVVGPHTVIAALSGIGGSVRLGASVVLGGQAGVADHVTIGDGSIIAAQAGVIGDVAPGSVLSGYPARPHREFMRSMGMLRKLPALMRRLEQLARTSDSPESTPAPARDAAENGD